MVQQVSRIQFNNPYINFGNSKKKTVLQIAYKNPLITEDVRGVANYFNDFFNSIQGKTLTVNGLSIDYPIRCNFLAQLTDETSIPKKTMRLLLSKNSEQAKQIQSVQIHITEPDMPKRIIEYYPKRQIHGVWTDDLCSYYVRQSTYGPENYELTRDYE